VISVDKLFLLLFAFWPGTGGAAATESSVTFGRSFLALLLHGGIRKSYLAHAQVFPGSGFARGDCHFSHFISPIAD
jgi:hypothetical protein